MGTNTVSNIHSLTTTHHRAASEESSDLFSMDKNGSIHGIPCLSPNVPLCSTELQLRFLCPADLVEVKKLCADWFPIEYPDIWYREITSNQKFYSLAAVYEKKIVGLIVSEIKPKSTCNREDQDVLAACFPISTQVAYILSLGVAKEYRRHGLASLLLGSLLLNLASSEHYSVKAVYLHVLTTNLVAIRFYEKKKFLQHTYLPYYYSVRGVPKDAFTYVLYINNGFPPWTIIDYVKHISAAVSKMKPCAISARVLGGVCNLIRRLIPGMTPQSCVPCSSDGTSLSTRTS